MSRKGEADSPSFVLNARTEIEKKELLTVNAIGSPSERTGLSSNVYESEVSIRGKRKK